MRRYHVFALSGAIGLLLPAMVAAAALPGTIVSCTGVACGCSDLVKTAQNLLNTGIYFAVFVSAILFAWGGWKMIHGKTMGEGDQISEAKKILWNVIIGLVIILAAWLLVDTLMRTITKSETWSDICSAIK